MIQVLISGFSFKKIELNIADIKGPKLIITRVLATLVFSKDINNNVKKAQIDSSVMVGTMRYSQGYEKIITSDESIDWNQRQNKFTNKFIGKNKYKKGLENYLNQIWESEAISIPYKVKEKTFF